MKTIFFLFLFCAQSIHAIGDNGPEATEKLLISLQHPNAFNQASLRALKSILESDVSQPQLIAGALQTLLLVYPDTYRKTIESFPGLRSLRVIHWENPYRTVTEAAQIHTAAVDYVKSEMKRLIPQPRAKTVLSDWTYLAPLGSCLTHADESLVDDIMESLVFHALEYEMKGIFTALIARFAYATVLPVFGGKALDDTTLEIVRNNETLTPYILGTQPVIPYKPVQNSYGFYVHRLDDISIQRTPKSESYQWEHAKKSYHSTVNLIPVHTDRPIVSTDPSPPYRLLWTNDSFTGLVVFGYNLEDEANEVIGAYQEYFKANGFRALPLRKTQNAKNYLKNQLVSGETRWVIKEAHSEGDSTTLFELSNEAEIVTFVKGKETVRLIYTAPSSKSRSIISNQEFGEWMRERERRSKIPLLYFNASCWSVEKAQNEIPEAHTPFLIEILTTSITDFFRFKPDNAMRILLDDLRNNKTYAQMRESLKANEHYVRGTGDAWVFPDEPRYQDLVFKERIPLMVRIVTE